MTILFTLLLTKSETLFIATHSLQRTEKLYHNNHYSRFDNIPNLNIATIGIFHVRYVKILINQMCFLENMVNLCQESCVFIIIWNIWKTCFHPWNSACFNCPVQDFFENKYPGLTCGFNNMF